VVWAFQITDRCTGRTQVVPGGSMVVGAGSTQLTVVNGIRLPAGRALAISVLVDLPARAASHPLLVPSSATC
jgi:hypothetical protein